MDILPLDSSFADSNALKFRAIFVGNTGWSRDCYSESLRRTFSEGQKGLREILLCLGP
jgi:hypothetical protein